jgi:hypothetical protein
MKPIRPISHRWHRPYRRFPLRAAGPRAAPSLCPTLPPVARAFALPTGGRSFGFRGFHAFRGYEGLEDMPTLASLARMCARKVSLRSTFQARRFRAASNPPHSGPVVEHGAAGGNFGPGQLPRQATRCWVNK